MMLFHIQDSDRPMYVVATDWNEALAKWREVIAIENEEADCFDDNPDGIALVAEDDELIL